MEDPPNKKATECQDTMGANIDRTRFCQAKKKKDKKDKSDEEAGKAAGRGTGLGRIMFIRLERRNGFPLRFHLNLQDDPLKVLYKILYATLP